MGRHHNQTISAEDRKPKDRSLSHPNALTIVLYQPRIPQNTGSIARMCAATGCRLDLISPFFKIDDSKLKRAGLDYWHLLDVNFYDSLDQWLNINSSKKIWLVEVGSQQKYTDVSYDKADCLMFGDEQDGIPQSLLQKTPDKHISLPQQGVRSLNLATTVAVVGYEALRQLNWYSIQP